MKAKLIRMVTLKDWDFPLCRVNEDRVSNRKGNRTINVKIERRAESQEPEKPPSLFRVWTCEPQKKPGGEEGATFQIGVSL